MAMISSQSTMDLLPADDQRMGGGGGGWRAVARRWSWPTRAERRGPVIGIAYTGRRERVGIATLARLLPRERWPAFLVTPATLLRWHRELVARRWTYPPTGRGSNSLPSDVGDLVVRMARENPRRAT